MAPNWALPPPRQCDLNREILIARLRQDDLCKDQLILTSSSVSRDYDYALRMFGTKNLGVIEDPVTGSAQPPIFSYWSEELKKENFCVYQASERGGLMQVKRDIRGIDVNGKVKLVKKFYQEI